MGKRIEKAFGREKQSASTTHHDDDDPNRTPEPYTCTGHFANDFSELCRRNSMVVIPPVVARPHRPPTPPPPQAAEEKSKPGKKDDKKNQPPPEPEPELELDENGEPPEQPPKTYTTKDKFEFFKPSVQVEMDNPDKLDTVTEVYVRGWKVDEPMMTIFQQCFPKMDRLHTISLWGTGLNDTSLKLLSEFLPECANIKYLTLDNNAVAGEQWHLLLKEESPVQHLSLRYNGITDKGAELLGKALGTVTTSNQKLVTLNLNGNKISDAGAVALAGGLRTNRTLLALSLGNNLVGNKAAKVLGEVISTFAMTHEEIVERRKLMSSAPERKSPPPGGKRSDSRDRPGSVRSNSHAAGGTTKGKSANRAKKDTKGGKEEEKHDKSKGKKDQDKGGTKKASLVADTGKAAKTKEKKGGKKGAASQDTESLPEEPTDSTESLNPLLDKVEHLDNGVTLILGNRSLISLNLAHNHITEDGLRDLLKGVGVQTSIAALTSGKSPGLMRLSLNKNKVSSDNETLEKLNTLMLTKDPFYKPPPTPEEQQLQQRTKIQSLWSKGLSMNRFCLSNYD